MKKKLYRGLYFKYYLTRHDFNEIYLPDASFSCLYERDAKECWSVGAKIISHKAVPDDIDTERHRYTLIAWDSEEEFRSI